MSSNSASAVVLPCVKVDILSILDDKILSAVFNADISFVFWVTLEDKELSSYASGTVISTFLFSSTEIEVPLTEIDSIILVSPLSESVPSLIVAVVVPLISVQVIVAILPSLVTVTIGDTPSAPFIVGIFPLINSVPSDIVNTIWLFVFTSISVTETPSFGVGNVIVNTPLSFVFIIRFCPSIDIDWTPLTACSAIFLLKA